jgi:hypothetical protein
LLDENGQMTFRAAFLCLFLFREYYISSIEVVHSSNTLYDEQLVLNFKPEPYWSHFDCNAMQ